MLSLSNVISSSRMFRSFWQGSFLKTFRHMSKVSSTFEVVHPQKVSSQIQFDSLTVPLPPYAKTGQPPALSSQYEPEIKSPEAIEKMRNSCRLAKKILDSVKDIIRVGQTTEEIDKFVHQMSIDNNAVSQNNICTYTFLEFNVSGNNKLISLVAFYNMWLKKLNSYYRKLIKLETIFRKCNLFNSALTVYFCVLFKS